MVVKSKAFSHSVTSKGNGPGPRRDQEMLRSDSRKRAPGPRRDRTGLPDDSVVKRDFRGIIYRHLQDINSPRSLAIYLIMRETDCNPDSYDDEVLNLVVNPAWFLTASEFSGFYDPTELVRKWTGLVLSVDPEQVARGKFYAAEEQCQVTNRRILNDDVSCPNFASIRERLRRTLSSMLGPVTSDILSTCVSEGGWGKGVTSSCKGKWLTEYHKLEAPPQATRAFADLASALMRDVSPLWCQEIDIVEGSKLAFVPKDARTHRSIAVEPSLNMYLQKGIGLAIRRRMRRHWALDLTTQRRNQELAYRGSRDGTFATIDLSSASDTVSYQVVEKLLPPDWVALLRSCRCSFTSDDGTPVFLQKWSSMGNGYTFELETAIFAAIVRECISHDDWFAGNWAVYGDDIIVPTQDAKKICDLLAYFGFTLNSKKTFIDGPFRESCGADYFLGQPVRPFYLGEVDWLSLCNYANWIRSFKRSWSIKRTWHAIQRLLGADFPRVPPGTRVNQLAYRGLRFPFPSVVPTHGLIGLEIDEWDTAAGFVPKVTENGYRGYPVSGLYWKPVSRSPNAVGEDSNPLFSNGSLLVLAHLRLLTARRFSDLSEPWQLTMKQTGNWRRKRSLCEEWPSLPLR